MGIPGSTRWLAAVALIVWSSPAIAQDVTGAIRGRVVLGDVDEPLPGAVVVVTGGGVARTVIADSDGAFRIAELAPGRYQIALADAGFGAAPVTATVGDGETTVVLAIGVETVVIEERFLGRADRLRESAEAVAVVETTAARRESADLGELLARSEGVGVRRSGGLGSATRLSLAGFSDERVRVFLDGVPLALTGHPMGIGNVPVNVVDQVEVYRGVVPVRFGADALGGAINLASAEMPLPGTGGDVSYQVGSFGTHRLSAGVRHRDQRDGIVARASGFFDRATNDYPMTVDAIDESGRPTAVRARRLADGYRAWGGFAEAGVVGRPWAEHLLVRAYVGQHDKDVPHNLMMTVPYGDVVTARRSGGVQLRYAVAPTARLHASALAGYGYLGTTFVDRGQCRYDWLGACVFMLPQPGEIAGLAIDQSLHQHAGYARADLGWTLAPGHVVRAALAPTAAVRSGRDRATLPGDHDPLSGERFLTSAVAGVEYHAEALGDRLANIAFAKGYLQVVRADERLANGNLRDVAVTTRRVGAGDSARLRLADGVQAKLSYEYATRLPSIDETFGDGALVVENLHLAPERSHNLNAGVEARRATAVGTLRLDATGFARIASDLVVQLPSASYSQFVNVASARILGVGAEARWALPRDVLALAAGVTWQDARNTSTTGDFAAQEGDRIANQPSLLATASARLAWPDLVRRGDTATIALVSRYVESFYKGWESLGRDDDKLVIPDQLVHSVVVGYRVEAGGRAVSTTLEVQNLTDETTFDFYGVQRPGRAAFAKLVVEL
jgi:vitamin B12 transporter